MVPFPVLLSQISLIPYCWASVWAIVSPKPVPPAWRLRDLSARQNLSNIYGKSSAAIPIPVSEIIISNVLSVVCFETRERRAAGP